MSQSTNTTTDQRADELLGIRCQLGERAAFDELIERYATRLRAYVRRVADDDAEADDLVQDTWLRVLRGLPGLRQPARLRSWLFGIAHRVLIDRLRLRYAEPAAWVCSCCASRLPCWSVRGDSGRRCGTVAMHCKRSWAGRRAAEGHRSDRALTL